MITLTCGHTVEDVDDANDIALASYNRENNRCVDYVSYCDECYDAALDRGEVLLTVDDEDVWLADIHKDVRERIQQEVEETKQDLETIKYRGEYFETTTGHIMQSDNKKSAEPLEFNKNSEDLTKK